MPRYARDTSVPVERSKAQIESMIANYGATAFTTGWTTGQSAWVGFRLKELFIKFVLPLPKQPDKNVRKWENETRQRWRCLALVVKAKLEAVECGISTLEKEFLAFIVMPNDITVGDWMQDIGLPAIRSGKVPLALQANKDEIPDAEVV